MPTRWITALLVVLCLEVSALAEYSPAKCQKQPMPLVRDLNDLSLRFPGAGLGVAYFSLFNTPMSAGEQIPESGRLVLDPGAAFPIHRHPPGAAEMMFVLSGTGLHEVMVPGNSTIDKQVMSRYKMYYAPGNGVHKVSNDGDEPLDLLVFTASTFSPFTLFNEWPASTDAEGTEVTMPWESSCPAGQELKEEL